MNQFSSEALWWSHQQQQTTQPPTSPSSKYKGVVPQPNGRWGAQIYENNHRLWLGTFDSQEAAALSYDRAASMFRGSDANLNFHQQNSQSPKQDNEETEDEDIQEEDEREHMFEKPLTPSDVGKLNRLVIPKQHAEKYFPLAGGGGGESGGEKGLLLSFEDESGKLWRFRYSYWNSSQSYVLTKGWSRFVKEKQLDAGDVVWFERRRLDAQHLFIRWRRRVPPVQDSGVTHYPPHQSITPQQQHTSSAWTQVFYSAHPYPSHLHGPLSYQQPPDCLHAAPSVEPVVQNPSTPPANTKRFRLFGVNLDCQLDECEPSRSDGSSQGRGHFLSSQGHEASSHNSSYKDYNFSSGDIDETRYDRGRDLSM